MSHKSVSPKHSPLLLSGSCHHCFVAFAGSKASRAHERSAACIRMLCDLSGLDTDSSTLGAKGKCLAFHVKCVQLCGRSLQARFVMAVPKAEKKRKPVQNANECVRVLLNRPVGRRTLRRALTITETP